MEIIINSKLGKIKGKSILNHQEFLGLRYAQPPIGKLRFALPQPLTAWDEIYDATNYGPMAPQAYPDDPPIPLEESEDCLFLNIYTPKADEQKRPVMVFIHGGGLKIGSGSQPRLYGGHLTERGDVIVVSIQYRIGVLGFLYLEGIPPNIGLFDQICALSWIQTHISSFGGDPYNITLFGQSAGAISISYLLLLSQTRGLFHKIILQSGSLRLDPVNENRKSAELVSQKILKILKVAPNDISTLQNIPLPQLMRAQRKVTGKGIFTRLGFNIVLDGKFCPLDVHFSFENTDLNTIPMLIGINEDELPFFGSYITRKFSQWMMKKIFFNPIITQAIHTYDIRKSDINDLLKMYRDLLLQQHRYRNYREYDLLLTDMFFRIPAIIQADHYVRESGKVYFYCFSYKALQLQASVHVLELYFVFGTLDTKDIANKFRLAGIQEESDLSRKIMDAWIHFARNGNPNHSNLPSWPLYDPTIRPTLILDIQPQILTAPMNEITMKWRKILQPQEK